MTDKEVRAIAIKEVTYADMIAIGATEYEHLAGVLK